MIYHTFSASRTRMVTPREGTERMTELRLALRWLVLALAILICAAVGAFLASRPLIKLRPEPVGSLGPDPDPALTIPEVETGGNVTFLDGNGTSFAPEHFPIKANKRSGIYHMPGDFAYVRTVASRHYRSSESAEADGFRHARR